MKTKFLKRLPLIVLLLVAISCNNEEISFENPQNHAVENAIKNSEMGLSNTFAGRAAASDCHFEYEGELGPEHWADLCGMEWEDCAGNSQSPINIVTENVIEDGGINNINTNYTVSTADIYNNGHTVQFNYTEGSYANLNNIDYNLLQFHFHTGSEHTVNGKRYPMEVHLVHQDPITKLLAVVGVFFEEGDSNKVLKEYFNNLPENEGDIYVNNSSEFHIEDLLPDDLEFYTYSGSLTTPGCSEIVTWYVLKDPITASAAQLEKLERIMHKNYRPIQELNGRIVRTKS